MSQPQSFQVKDALGNLHTLYSADGKGLHLNKSAAAPEPAAFHIDLAGLPVALNHFKAALANPQAMTKQAAGITDRLVDAIGSANSVGDAGLSMDLPMKIQFRDKAARDLFMSLGRSKQAAPVQPLVAAGQVAHVIKRAFAHGVREQAIEKIASEVYGQPKPRQGINRAMVTKLASYALKKGKKAKAKGKGKVDAVLLGRLR